MSRLNTLSLALLVVSAGLTQPVLAAIPGTFYLGGAIGSVSNDYSSGRCNDDSLNVISYIDNQNGVIAECSIKARDNAYKLLFGHYITSNFSMEFAYADLGRISASFNDVSMGRIVKSIEQQTVAVTLDGVGTFWLSNGFSMSAKLGLYTAGQKSSDDLNDDKNAHRSRGLNIGVAGSHAFNPNLSARLEFERYSDVGTTNVTDNFDNYKAPSFKSNIDLFSLGLVFNF